MLTDFKLSRILESVNVSRTQFLVLLNAPLDPRVVLGPTGAPPRGPHVHATPSPALRPTPSPSDLPTYTSPELGQALIELDF